MRALSPSAPSLARYYDPTTAQFLTVDPDVATTHSPYGYVAGDPINSNDADGRTPADSDGPGICQGGYPTPFGCYEFGIPGGGSPGGGFASVVGLCLGGEFIIGVGPAGSLCFVSNGEKSAITVTLGGGGGLSAGASGGFETSNATCPLQLGNEFTGYGASAGPFSGSYQSSTSGSVQVGYAGLGVGVGLSRTATWTWVIPLP
jgi:hypothetical protein